MTVKIFVPVTKVQHGSISKEIELPDGISPDKQRRILRKAARDALKDESNIKWDDSRISIKQSDFWDMGVAIDEGEYGR